MWSIALCFWTNTYVTTYNKLLKMCMILCTVRHNNYYVGGMLKMIEVLAMQL